LKDLESIEFPSVSNDSNEPVRPRVPTAGVLDLGRVPDQEPEQSRTRGLAEKAGVNASGRPRVGLRVEQVGKRLDDFSIMSFCSRKSASRSRRTPAPPSAGAAAEAGAAELCTSG